jgi:hypothetical protein
VVAFTDADLISALSKHGALGNTKKITGFLDGALSEGKISKDSYLSLSNKLLPKIGYVVDAEIHEEFSQKGRAEDLLGGEIGRDGRVRVTTTLKLGGVFKGSKSLTTISGKYDRSNRLQSPFLKLFGGVVQEMRRQADDLRPMFRALSKEFFKTNDEEIFSDYKGYKIHPPLSAWYQAAKSGSGNDDSPEEWGSVQPILVGTERYNNYLISVNSRASDNPHKPGLLRKSLIDQAHPKVINYISKKTMSVGSSVEEAKYMQTGFRSVWKDVVAPPRRPVQVGSVMRQVKFLNIAQSFAATVDISKIFHDGGGTFD